ncbi:L-serine dehydratase, iron-sulfur-dependent subunit beta [Streptococcus pneumoniae]|nr:L-serine dehydratase, iron-sulfur-dependent subunit beta [Streptococcus pneumoniae]
MKSLRFQSVFDIIGPVMIGPSSSHTAGAVRIGRLSLPFLMILRQKLNSNFLTHLPRPIVVTEQT